MKRTLISVLMALLLVAAMAVPTVADDVPASVTVNTFASVTIQDEGVTGLSFGSLDPGAVKQAEAEVPSMTVTTASENNVDITISISGTDFSDGGLPANTFAIANAYYNTTNDAGTAVTMSTTPTAIGAALTPGDGMDLYHWLSIPSNQTAAVYSSTFTYTSSY